MRTLPRLMPLVSGIAVLAVVAACGVALAHTSGGHKPEARLTAEAPLSAPTDDFSARANKILQSMGYSAQSSDPVTGNQPGQPARSAAVAPQVVTLTSPQGSIARVTFQPDNAGLQQAFDTPNLLPDGAQYGIQHAGDGDLLCVLRLNGNAVLLSFTPANSGDQMGIPDSQLANLADRLLKSS